MLFSYKSLFGVPRNVKLKDSRLTSDWLKLVTGARVMVGIEAIATPGAEVIPCILDAS